MSLFRRALKCGILMERNLEPLLLTMALAWIIAPGSALCQTTESLAVQTISREAPEWLIEAVSADNFRESGETEAIKSRPYNQVDEGRSINRGTVFHQPAGSLTGKVVFTMAGHGWTYDAEKMYYYTQRGLSHGMVEDMGNADQMHIFAHLLFNSGATVVPFRPVDYQPNERILDNQMPQVEYFGEWVSGNADSYYGSPGDSVPYAVAKAELAETAVARYRPYIPESGYYPVYVWARDGADRSNQLYRIAYSGGTAEIRVNWRYVGKTWVWLGTYYFEQGADGYVEISNRVIDPYEAYNGHIVIADAVRFGNGYGDVPRPGGISGYPREDEGDSYWIQRALGVNADRRLYDVGRDGSSTVSSPPKAAAYANRELEGSFLDRVLVSFHSNASSGKARGAVALFNASADQRPSYQELFAEVLGDEVNRQMAAAEILPDEDWVSRERNTYSGINFGELRRDYIQNEMCATIVETAFHDNEADASFLLNPLARIQMAQATLRGLLRWYADVAYPNSAYVLPPARPVAVAATSEDGEIRVRWKTGPVGEFEGGTPLQVRVYRSVNGYGFDGGVSTEATAEGLALDPLTTSGVTFIRVTAVNPAGESFPSQTIAVGMGNSRGEDSRARPATNLLVSLTKVLDSSANVPYDLGRQPGGPYRDSAETERVRALYTLMEPSGAEEAFALAALGEKFNGADTGAVLEELMAVDDYKRVFVTAEEQNPRTPIFSNELQAALRSFVSKDGKLYLSGSGVAANLSRHGGDHREFLRDIMGVASEKPAPATTVLSSADNRFLPTTSTIALLSSSSFWDTEAIIPAQLEPREGRSISLLLSATPGEADASAAILTRPSYSEGEIFFLGFPFSLVKDQEMRVKLMQAILKQM